MKRLMLEIFILNVGIMSVEYLYYYSMVKNMINKFNINICVCAISAKGIM